MSVLRDIYRNEYDPAKPLGKMPFSLRLKERAFYDAIESTMGADFIERHWDGLCKVEEFQTYTSFREGFRLGVALMMELL